MAKTFDFLVLVLGVVGFAGGMAIIWHDLANPSMHGESTGVVVEWNRIQTEPREEQRIELVVDLERGTKVGVICEDHTLGRTPYDVCLALMPGDPVIVHQNVVNGWEIKWR